MADEERDGSKPFMPCEKDRKALLAWARESISAELEGRGAKEPDLSPALNINLGAFVTLNKNDSLRGCIGLIAGRQPLIDTIHEMALAAAFDDPRFPAVRAEELPSIIIEITILTPLKKLPSTDDIVIGRHGLYLVKGGYSGIFLPQVPVEWGWDRQTYLNELCHKAGLPAGSWKAPDAQLFYFEGAVFSEKKE